LLDKTKDLNKQIERLKSEISVLTAEKANAEKTIQQYQKSVQEGEAAISKLEAIIISNELEIEHLRNLKWYHKLFRK
jgi:chromosome segregation ATPase